MFTNLENAMPLAFKAHRIKRSAFFVWSNLTEHWKAKIDARAFFLSGPRDLLYDLRAREKKGIISISASL